MDSSGSMKAIGRFERYVLLALLDEGGMGSVYRARDERLDREVALKILRDPAEAEARSRALREARAVAALEHPNVVAIYDVGESLEEGDTTPTVFIAMELIRGESLRALVGRASVGIEERVRCLRDVCSALGYAHERGIIHRDVKPENVMVRSDGVVKVLDFGIARRSPVNEASAVLPTLTERGVVLGTPRYMAPEQMLGEELDGRADQFAWGVLAYELLSGTPPWSGTSDSIQAVAEMLMHPHTPLRERARNVPEALAAIVERAMSRSRRERFASMADVEHALDDWLSDAGRPGRGTRRIGVRAAPRHRARRYGVVAAVGLAVAGGALLATRHAGTVPVARCAADFDCARGATCVGGACSAAPPCSPHDCTARAGKPSVCSPEKVCALLASEDCRIVSAPADVGNDRTIWLGAMFPLTGPDADAYGLREFHAVDLARSEIARVMGGTNARAEGPGAGSSHPIALLACDDAVDPTRVIRHLVDDVGVPGVIGFRSSQEAIDIATSTLLPKGVLGLSALNTSPMLTRLPRQAGQPRLIWRTAVSSMQTAVAAGAVVPDVLEPLVRAGGLGNSAPLRVALVRQDDSAGQGFADAVFRSLHFNGRPAVENGPEFQEILFPFASNAPLDAPYAAAAAKIAAFAPHVIVYFGGDENFARVLLPLERDWPVAMARPVYLKPAVFGAPITTFVGKSRERRHRFFGMTSMSSSVANARFVARYNEAYADQATRTFSPNSSYDAFYLLAYATFAAGEGAVTGSALARAFPRLIPPGEAVDVGPEGVFQAYDALSSGRNIDLNGATGSLDFDVGTGEAPVDLAVLCLGVDSRGAATDSIESGVVFDATTRALRGAMVCP
jgi:serine/threonine-protein kinase